jgi:RNA-directed DNA polymerase
LALNIVEKSANGIIGRAALAEGRNDGRRRPQVKSSGSASDNRFVPAATTLRDEPAAGEPGAPESIPNFTLLARVLERENLRRALKQVRQNQGAPGIDGMSVDELPDYLRHHWPEIRAQLVAGSYCPQPVRRVEIPKDNGSGVRLLGVPTVLDRFIQQAIAQVVSAQWEPHFHPKSYGFRPQRSAHQAVRQLQADIREGYPWVVDLDLEAFLDRAS